MIPNLSLSAGGGGPSGSGTGDQSAGIGSAFTFNNAFSVGGSGSLKQTNDSKASSDGGTASLEKPLGGVTNTVIYAVLGLVLVLGGTYAFIKLRSK